MPQTQLQHPRGDRPGNGHHQLVITIGAFVLAAIGSSAIAIVSGRTDLALATMATTAAWVTCVEGALLFHYL